MHYHKSKNVNNSDKMTNVGFVEISVGTGRLEVTFDHNELASSPNQQWQFFMTASSNLSCYLGWNCQVDEICDSWTQYMLIWAPLTTVLAGFGIGCFSFEFQTYFSFPPFYSVE